MSLKPANTLKLWWTKMVSKIVPAMSRVRLTSAVFIIILGIGIITETVWADNFPVFVQNYGWDLTTLQKGYIYAAWIGLFFSAEPLDFYGILLLLLFSTGALEYRHGAREATLGFFIIGPIASIITLLVLWLISNAGIAYVRVALFTPDTGASTACLVCLGMFLIQEKGRLHIILIFVALIILGALFYQNAVYNIDHLNGYLIGLGSGALLKWRKNRRQTT